jgi:hypothetical protein
MRKASSNLYKFSFFNILRFALIFFPSQVYQPSRMKISQILMKMKTYLDALGREMFQVQNLPKEKERLR